MTELPKGVEIDGIYCYEDARLPSGALYYIPGKPQAERASSGRPLLSLLTSSLGAILQLQTRWDVGNDVLTELARKVADHIPEFDAVELRLAQTTNPQVSLIVGTGRAPEDDTRSQQCLEADSMDSEEQQILGTTKSSGISPYTTILNVPLTAAEKVKAVAALNGNKHNLLCKYAFSVSAVTSIAVTVEGDVLKDVEELAYIEKEEREKSSSIRDWFNWGEKEEEKKEKPDSKPLTLARCVAQIKQALTEERLVYNQIAHGDAPDELRAEANAEAINLAATKLLEIVRSAEAQASLPDEAAVLGTAKRTETTTFDLERITDIGSWFSKDTGADLIRVSPGVIDEPDRGDASYANASKPSGNEPIKEEEETEKVVQLGFEGKEAPISMIKVTCGQKTSRLRPPRFRPVTLSAPAGTPLQIDIRYKGTSKPFTTQLEPEDGDWAISPEDLGLVKVVIDASAVKEQKAKRAQISLEYQPDADGVKDRTRISFSQRDDEWIVPWYVITRSPTLAGIIEWKLDRGDPVATNDPLIIVPPQE
ncbi:MAG: hypothetical protein AAF702_41880 [Chloroflexota bacterium]